MGELRIPSLSGDILGQAKIGGELLYAFSLKSRGLASAVPSGCRLAFAVDLPDSTRLWDTGGFGSLAAQSPVLGRRGWSTASL